MVGYDVKTGERVWGGGSASAHYSSPVLTTIAGVRQTLIFDRRGVTAHDLSRGNVLWQHDWPGGHPHITMPIVLENDRVLVSSGYGTGSQMLQVSNNQKWKAEPIWHSKRLKSKFANVIAIDEFLFGLDDGILVCLDASNGKLKWKRGRYGHGQMLLIDRLLLIMGENGDVILVDPVPDEHRELTRFSALRRKTWNPPAIAGELLLVRNDLEAACFRLPLAK